ncbi:uncharacterized protein LOC112346046 [Selaginella moellendorffii]|uniref:uncharacterized protein LOC112346046 n=1 Tax=Selaginella moellendorffii TaxID=88036 RepID=UPI000D1C273F|nr:uncharacterized protein LOC112346046 [Selaginella moellendorffii]|eukprot:XP_024529815.1 uncharacterized protein LOC112346046 [Selaginella moellendorffii]
MRSIAEQVLDVGIVAWLEGGIPLIFSLLGSTPEELCQKCALSDQASFPSSEIAPFTLAFVVDYALSLSRIHASMQSCRENSSFFVCCLQHGFVIALDFLHHGQDFFVLICRDHGGKAFVTT